MEKARDVANDNGIIMGGCIEEVFGNLAPCFTKEIMSPEHMKIGIEELAIYNPFRKEEGEMPQEKKGKKHPKSGKGL
jgi:hypothetical protein